MRQIERRSHKAESSLNSSDSRQVRKKKSKVEKQQQKQKLREEKALEADNKRKMDIQTAETRKRMKETRKKADEYNNQGHESFFKRLFKRKKPKT